MGQLFGHFALPFEFSFGKSSGILKRFLDAARSCLRSAVIEDREQMTATVRGRHALPAREGAGIARES